MSIQSELRALKNEDFAKVSQRFFKTGKGEYGEGDRFLGLTVPQIRKIATAYLDLSFAETEKLLASRWHEERLAGAIILVYQFERIGKNKTISDRDRETHQKKVFRFYLDHRASMNNWDIVDVSAPNIVGTYLLDKDRKELYRLAKSKSLWDRRIAIVSTFAFIRNNDLDDTFQIAEILLRDPESLIHKATGWMLREAGKRDKKALIVFLDRYAHQMPRTMLRYAIERFSDSERKRWMCKQ